MNIEKTKQKLKKLSHAELENLLWLVESEMDERPQYISNTKNTPREQSDALSRMFSQAWIHG